ncbi:cytochrome P450 [Kitasatospora sp. MAP12-15]|nr:cytochrome P450 [Kitasatospora sp. MAP12-44]MDH6112296.1 cytochrome P450 [Kitasatospora sp. MAP12-44]
MNAVIFDPAPQLALPAPRGVCPFDPPPAYQQAHREDPILRVTLWDSSVCHLLTGHQQVRAALVDRRFSSDARNPGFPYLTPGRQGQPADKPNLQRLDGPEHARQRKMLTSDFLPKRIDAMRPEIQRIVDDAIDRMVAHGGPVDLVSEFALPVPLLVICLLLGVPYSDSGFFAEQTHALTDDTAGPEQVRGAGEALMGYLIALAARKREEPDDGIISRLAERGDLSLPEVASTGMLMLVAGHETTASMIGLSTLALLRHPEQAARLRADASATKGAVEELLRYLTVVNSGLPRVATEDVEIDGTLIRAGEGVICMLSTANRDEALFQRADEIDLARDAKRHLAFGFGAHQCLGQSLARAELQIALETLFRRLPGLRLATPYEGIGYRDQMMIFGVQELPVSW